MNYCLEPEAVEEFNRGHVSQTGEPFGIRDPKGLAGALARPLGGFDGVEVYSTPPAKAGALLHGLAQAHPFLQGNKRTAWTAATTYLGLHGFGLDSTDDEATAFVLAVVTGEFDAQGIALWMSDRLTV